MSHLTRSHGALRAGALLACCLLLACATARAPTVSEPPVPAVSEPPVPAVSEPPVPAVSEPPVLDALLGERLIVPLDQLALRVPLAPDQDFRVALLGRSEHTSHHVGAIRFAEPLHRHDRHDLLVLLVRGHGTQRIGDETRPVGVGSLLFVPRGVAHAFSNAGPEPAIAYLVYSPAFDGTDRVLVESQAP